MKENKKNKCKIIIAGIVFFIVVLAFSSVALHFLNTTGKAKKQEIIEIQKEIKEWKDRAEEVIRKERENKEPKKIISDDGTVCVAKSFKDKDLEKPLQCHPHIFLKILLPWNL